MQETINELHSDFYAKKSIDQQHRIRIYLGMSVIIIFIVCLTFFFIWRILRLRNKSQQAELEATIESVISMKAYSDKVYSEKISLQNEIKEKNATIDDIIYDLNHKTSLIDRLQHETKEQRIQIEKTNRQIEQISKEHKEINDNRNIILGKLFREKWKTLNLLCEEYYQKSSSQKMKESIIRNIESEIISLGSEESLKTIESEVNKYLGGIVEKLRKELPSFKNKDIAFCSLMFAGFTPKAICYILDIQNGNFYVKKGRLIKRIKESDSPYKDDFISLLK